MLLLLCPVCDRRKQKEPWPWHVLVLRQRLCSSIGVVSAHCVSRFRLGGLNYEAESARTPVCVHGVCVCVLLPTASLLLIGAKRKKKGGRRKIPKSRCDCFRLIDWVRRGRQLSNLYSNVEIWDRVQLGRVMASSDDQINSRHVSTCTSARVRVRVCVVGCVMENAEATAVRSKSIERKGRICRWHDSGHPASDECAPV
jgi:hypothetical protein